MQFARWLFLLLALVNASPARGDVDPLATWKSTLAALPKTSNNAWAANFASWYAGRIAAITTNPAQLVPSGFVFTFSQSTFKTQLEALAPQTTSAAGILGFANAWEAALNATTVVLAPGTFKPPTSPPTLFSVVASSVIDPASIALGKAKLLELVTAPPVSDPNSSLFPQKFRDATLLLTITVSGLDSQPPPTAGPGPQPLTVPTVSLK